MIYITGDTHGNINRFFDGGALETKLTENDTLIICGDFGFVKRQVADTAYWIWIDKLEREWYLINHLLLAVKMILLLKLFPSNLIAKSKQLLAKYWDICQKLNICCIW